LLHHPRAALSWWVGAWGVSLADRLLRFVATSALFHLAAAPLSYVLWRDYLRNGFTGPDPTLPLWLWLVAGIYVALPIALGVVIGQGALKGHKLALRLAGSNAAPTAWDFLFSPSPNGWVRCKLKSGTWVGGAFADGSYAGGHPPSKAKTWGQRRGYAAGRKTVAELKAPSKASGAASRPASSAKHSK
jgi:hypothetical protein